MKFEPNLTPFHQAALQTFNHKKPEERDQLEEKLAQKIAVIEDVIKKGNMHLEELQEKAVKIQEALQRACGAYEGFLDFLSEHYQDQMEEKKSQKSHGRPISTTDEKKKNEKISLA